MTARGQANDISAIAVTFGRNLKAARLAAGLTQHQLAVELGRGDNMTVSRWERGENRPSDEYMVALAERLGVTVAWLYTDHDPERDLAA